MPWNSCGGGVQNNNHHGVVRVYQRHPARLTEELRSKIGTPSHQYPSRASDSLGHMELLEVGCSRKITMHLWMEGRWHAKFGGLHGPTSKGHVGHHGFRVSIHSPKKMSRGVHEPPGLGVQGWWGQLVSIKRVPMLVTASWLGNVGS